VSVARTTNRGTGLRRGWRVAEALAWILGLVLLSNAAWRHFDGVIASRSALRTFEEVRSEPARERWPVDQTLWSSQRTKAFQGLAALPSPTALAILRIPRIHLEVPVLEGTDDRTLDRGVGHIADTAVPGVAGNIGLAGHRDGFFRGLKDVMPGDTIQLETHRGIDTYRIDRTWIVQPEDVSVLDPTPAGVLTLVTCYPFYFVGSAPERFIVRAVLSE
jgi:sortase A